MSVENRSEQAIIILDMINDLAHPQGSNYEPATAEIIPFLEGELKYFRERMRLVIFCHTASEQTNQFNAQVIQALSPRSKEILIKKHGPNAFFGTDLAQILRDNKVKNITIAGVFTHTNVIRSVAGALDHGFSVVVPETCTCARNPQDHQAALHLMDRWLTAI